VIFYFLKICRLLVFLSESLLTLSCHIYQTATVLAGLMNERLLFVNRLLSDTSETAA
jgi:TRAP-type mannitol/chloroaromatic compound transport system permease small subunit